MTKVIEDISDSKHSTTSERVINQISQPLLVKIRPYLFLAPSFILIFGFVYIPLLIALMVSLYGNPGLVVISEEFTNYYANTDNLWYVGLGTFFSSLLENGFLPVFHTFALSFGAIGFYKIWKNIRPTISKQQRFIESFAVNLIITTLILNVLLFAITETGRSIRVPLRNYQDIFTERTIIGDFLRILLNTFLWAAICTFFHVLLGMILAVMLNGNFKGRKAFRTIFILPWAIPSFISAIVWRNFVFDSDRGILGKPVADNVSLNGRMVFTLFDLIIFLLFILIAVILVFHAAERDFLTKVTSYLLILGSGVAMIWIFSLNTTNLGILGNHFIMIDRITTKFFFSSDFYILGYKTKTIFLAAILTNIWLGVPFMMLSFLATLQSIPADLYEAAELDGASPWTKFKDITFPNLIPTLRTVVLLGMIWTFNLFNVFFILSQNQNGLGRRENWDIFITYIYFLFRTGTQGQPEYAAASALSFVVFLILVGFSKMYQFLFQEEME